jgi:hypothetical protein
MRKYPYIIFLPIGSPLLTTIVDLVTLVLGNIRAFAYFPPSHILTRFSHPLHLETLAITLLPDLTSFIPRFKHILGVPFSSDPRPFP